MSSSSRPTTCCSSLAYICIDRISWSLFTVPSHLWKTNIVAAIVLSLVVFVLNIFITPFLLVGKSLTSIFLPCLKETTHTLFYFLCSSCIASTKFSDTSFDATAQSLGDVEVGGQLDWVRLPELEFAKDDDKKDHALKMQLFAGGISPSDICQGGLGDCWLLAALAALSEQPHYIRSIFLTAQLNPRGKYQLRFYDPPTSKFITIVIDDRIPCHQGTKKPRFSEPNGNDSWTLLVEKAFAKYQKSYANIEGGFMLYALAVFTGCNVAHFSRSNGAWNELTLDVQRSAEPTKPDDIRFKSDQTNADKSGSKNDEEMFDVVVRMCRNRCILTAGSKGKDTTLTDGRGTDGGIVPGHAYSILGAYKPHLSTEAIHLVKLRNPWGKFEWNGDWSDKSEKWNQYPGVKLECCPKDDDNDGAFFMEWKDFLLYFNQIDVCLTGGDGLDSTSYQVEEGT